ncbi:MAG TPA: metalloregulator ArsR/SmtB family transcription factor [Ilumatobacter sp.]|jgi:ArsR family transcriptional regulator|nr:metalloregulator ArsR/SmtB family transcription factor [Ilumatobacter sp.]
MQTTIECCQPLLDRPLSPPDADRLATWFRVLGDPTRLRLLSLIAGKGEACAACDFVDALGVSQPTVSHHLRTLHEAGLVERDKRGRWVYYRVRADRLNALSQTLVSASQ